MGGIARQLEQIIDKEQKGKAGGAGTGGKSGAVERELQRTVLTETRPDASDWVKNATYCKPAALPHTSLRGCCLLASTEPKGGGRTLVESQPHTKVRKLRGGSDTGIAEWFRKT